VAYLGLGRTGDSGSSAPPAAPEASGEAPPPEPIQKVLLLRDGEDPDAEGVASRELVSLLAGPDLRMRPEIPIEDRARISKVLFGYLPLGIFPPLTDARARQWRAPAALPVLLCQAREMPCLHQVGPAGTAGDILYSVEAAAGQKTSFVQDRLEVPIELETLRLAWVLTPAQGRLRSFESHLLGRVVDGRGPAAELAVDLELMRVEAQELAGQRWEKLRAEAGLARTVERILFADLKPDLAQSKAAAFEKERAGSRLVPFVAGLGRQGDDLRPIANERRLYGKPAPDFTLRDPEGHEWTLSKAIPGKVTLLTFWGLG